MPVRNIPSEPVVAATVSTEPLADALDGAAALASLDCAVVGVTLGLGDAAPLQAATRAATAAPVASARITLLLNIVVNTSVC